MIISLMAAVASSNVKNNSAIRDHLLLMASGQKAQDRRAVGFAILRGIMFFRQQSGDRVEEDPSAAARIGASGWLHECRDGRVH